MRAIMTVTGLDRKGIIATIASGLAENGANITNVSQTIMDDYFTMILEIEFDDETMPLPELQKRMDVVGESVGMVVRIQSEAIFQAMHKL